MSVTGSPNAEETEGKAATCKCYQQIDGEAESSRGRTAGVAVPHTAVREKQPSKAEE